MQRRNQTRPGVMLYFGIRPGLKRLTAEEKGALFDAILDFGEFGVVPEFVGTLGVVWDFVQPRIEEDGRRYEEVRELRRSAANKRWGKSADANAYKGMHFDAPDANTEQSNPSTVPVQNTGVLKADKPPERKRFAPPPVGEVKAYISEMGYAVDARRFVDYYDANGWVQGKGKPIRDWRAAVRLWHSRDQAERQEKSQIPTDEDYLRGWDE